MGRVGNDFWFQDPNGNLMGVYWPQGVHMIHCAYNSLWIGHMMQPDWDMFQSDHLCAKFHAGSRAICGGPVYISDSAGGHDFDLEGKFVFPDGTIPKCLKFALPTRLSLACPWIQRQFERLTYSGISGSTLIFKGRSASIGVKGGGNFLTYCAIRNGSEVPFGWSEDDGGLTVDVPWDKDAGGISTLDFIF